MTGYKLNKYGLRDKDMDFMFKLFMKFPEIEKVKLYGSRARGDFNRGSDVDIALIGKDIDQNILSKIKYVLSEYSPAALLYDVIIHHEIVNIELLREIDEEGVEIYKNQNN